MLAYYQEALPDCNFRHEQAVSRAGIAWAKFLLDGTWAETDIADTLLYIESVPHLMMESLPFHPHLICYNLLNAAGDPRAEDVLIIAHEQIQRYASYIETPEWRASFLANEPENRALVDLYAARFLG